jgi:hypothetical protein
LNSYADSTGQGSWQDTKTGNGVKALQARVKAIQEMKTSKLRKEQIFGGINRLRGKQLPVGKIINDFNMAVPEGVWLERVTQLTASKLEDKKVPVRENKTVKILLFF